eukprot:TRINITY_DN2051_c0_g1_i1.p8 TRINITY_DN2051_c0_g1~~TRINITY_DN2051_c0_g1_i1.p8  ORF type:complete len:145 (-),score=5.96 TRINITY_DN2051_c0_g1_i1:1546-1980(-)
MYFQAQTTDLVYRYNKYNASQVKVHPKPLINVQQQQKRRRNMICCGGSQEDITTMRRRISPFYSWVSKFIDYKIKSANVEIRHVFGKGRGLCAIDTIQKKQEILRIPRQLILTADDAVKDSLFGTAMRECGLSEASILASHIAE